MEATFVLLYGMSALGLTALLARIPFPSSNPRGFIAAAVAVLLISACGLALARPRRLKACLIPSLLLTPLYILMAYAGRTLYVMSPWALDVVRTASGTMTDHLYRAGIAAMIMRYHSISTGLHGIRSFGYHALANTGYAAAAGLSGLSVMESYGYFYPIVLIPLLPCAFLLLAEKIRPSQGAPEALLRGVMCVAGMTAWRFDKAGVWDSFAGNDSYTLSLVLLAAFLALLLAPRSRARTGLLIASLFPLTIAKVSTGPVAAAIFGVDLLFCARDRLGKTILLGVAAGASCIAGLYFASSNVDSGVGAVSWGFGFPFLWGGVSRSLAGLELVLALIGFYLRHFEYTWAALVALWLAGRHELLEPAKLARLRWLNLAALVAGAVPMSILSPEDGNGYFFSNPSMFVGLTTLVALAAPLAGELRQGDARRRAVGLACAVVLGLGLLYAPFENYDYWTKWVAEWHSELELARGPDAPSAPYYRALREIREDPRTRDFLVYIPRTENLFWTDKRCDSTPLMIPTIAERPALFGVPKSSCRLADLRFFDYGHEVFAKSDTPHLDEATLREETAKLGFKGYVEVTLAGWRLFPVR